MIIGSSFGPLEALFSSEPSVSIGTVIKITAIAIGVFAMFRGHPLMGCFLTLVGASGFTDSYNEGNQKLYTLIKQLTSENNRSTAIAAEFAKKLNEFGESIFTSLSSMPEATADAVMRRINALLVESTVGSAAIAIT